MKKTHTNNGYEWCLIQYKCEQKKKHEFRIRARARARSSVIQIKKPNEQTN